MSLESLCGYAFFDGTLFPGFRRGSSTSLDRGFCSTHYRFIPIATINRNGARGESSASHVSLHYRPKDNGYDGKAKCRIARLYM